MTKGELELLFHKMDLVEEKIFDAQVHLKQLRELTAQALIKSNREDKRENKR